MNCVDGLTTEIRAIPRQLVAGAAALIWLGATVTGCSHGGTEADRNERASACTSHDVDADRRDRAVRQGA